MEEPSEEEEEYDSENMSYASEEEEPVKPIRRVTINKAPAKPTTTRKVRNVVQKIKEPSASQTVTESEEDDYNEPMTQDFKRRGLQSESEDEEEGYRGGYRNDFHTQPKLTPSNSSYSQSDLDEQIEKEREFAKKPIMVRGVPRRKAHSSEGSKKSKEEEDDILMSEDSAKQSPKKQ